MRFTAFLETRLNLGKGVGATKLRQPISPISFVRGFNRVSGRAVKRI
jgi:hypothetical protein